MEKHDKLILIIDDEPDFREIMSVKLQNAGFSVAQASSGPEGLDKAKESKPDLILLDVRMPGMTGIEVLTKMKSDPELSKLKVLFLTNLGEADLENSWIDEKFAKEAGALGHIRKTDDLEKIVERIKQAL